ncbi:hypothetical protein U8P71_03300 [Rhizobium ruizarguesonis]|nr:hypothetical protein U8P71_03300 [Rhizobium ruizarguesonis]
MGDDIEAIDSLQMDDIAPHAGGKVVEADHLVSGGQKRLAQMRSEETCTAGDKNSLGSAMYSGWIICIKSRSLYRARTNLTKIVHDYLPCFQILLWDIRYLLRYIAKPSRSIMRIFYSSGFSFGKNRCLFRYS